MFLHTELNYYRSAVVSKCLGAALLAYTLFSGTAVAQTTDIAINTTIDVPISVSCPSTLNLGTVSMLKTSWISPNSETFAYRINPLDPDTVTHGDATEDDVSISGQSRGECRVTGLNNDQIVTINLPAEVTLTNAATGAIINTDLAVADGEGFIEDSSVSYDLVGTCSPSPCAAPTISDENDSIDYDGGTGRLTFKVGSGSAWGVHFPVGTTPGDLVGSFSGTAEIQVTP